MPSCRGFGHFCVLALNLFDRIVAFVVRAPHLQDKHMPSCRGMGSFVFDTHVCIARLPLLCGLSWRGWALPPVRGGSVWLGGWVVGRGARGRGDRWDWVGGWGAVGGATAQTIHDRRLWRLQGIGNK